MDFVNIGTQAPVESFTPQAEIILCKGITWDNTYKHVRLYKTEMDLLLFLRSHAAFTITNAAPVRFGEAIVKLPYDSVKAAECNYMAFWNKPIENDRWHWAFITGVEYVSKNSCRVRYELDIFQECIFRCDITQKTFIKRSHIPVSKDTVGANTQPENFELGNYRQLGNRYQAPSADEQSKRAIVFACSTDTNGSARPGEMVQGVYSSMTYQIYSSWEEGNIEEINGFINDMTENGLIDSIVKIFQMPYVFATPITRDDFRVKIPRIQYGELPITPKNGKMYTYPYCYIEASNNQGQTVKYRFEDFAGGQEDTCDFMYMVNLDPNPTLVLVPLKYMRTAKNFDSAITFNGYPTCTIGVDAFKAWLAQTTSSLAIDRMADAFTAGTGISISDNLKDVFGAISGAVSLGSSGGVGNAIKQVTQALNKADGAKGVQSNNLMTTLNADCIYIYRKCIKAEYMRIIDDFWTMYGYPINRLQTPDVNSRKYWNYIETANCGFTGDVEMDMLAKFRAIFDNGVTIWHTDNVGNYNLANN